jgi:thiol-disulfide isomerase/thioredoxin
MNRKLLTIIIVIIALTIGSFVYLMTQDDPKDNQAATTPASDTTQTTPTEEKKDMEETSSAGRYVEYDESALAAAEGTKVLFFHAPWCPQCRALEASIQESTIPAGVTIFKVDYDTNQALRQKYGVTIQTTLVKIDDNGNLVEKYVAYDEPTFDAVNANLLQ